MQNTGSEKLLVVAINFTPELTGIGKYVGEMTEWLARQGMNVKVITAPPYYPWWSVQPGYSAWRYKVERCVGARTIRCPLWVPRKPRALTRVLHLLSFALTSLPVILWQSLTWRPQTIMVVEPPIACVPAALLGAKLCGARTWLHVQDFEVDAAFDLGLLRQGLLRRLLLGVESWLMRRFDTVSTISERMLERLGAKGVPPRRRMLFPNWVDTTLIRPVKGNGRLRKALGIDREAQVPLYSGNMGRKQGLELIIEAARLLGTDKSMQFVMCGDGAARAELEEQAKDLANVRFIPLQPAEYVNELLNMAEIHLLPQRADAEDLVMPSKLTAMLASGRPVIATARENSQVAKVVRQCGIVVEPGDTGGFVRAIRELMAHPERRHRLGSAGRAYAIAHWDKEVVLGRAFHSILDASRRAAAAARSARQREVRLGYRLAQRGRSLE